MLKFSVFSRSLSCHKIPVRLRLPDRRSFVMYTELQALDKQHEAVSVEARTEKHLTQDTGQGPSTKPEA